MRSTRGKTSRGRENLHSRILTRSLDDAFLKKAGFVSLKEITEPALLVNV